jgi:hypothetical protein
VSAMKQPALRIDQGSGSYWRRLQPNTAPALCCGDIVAMTPSDAAQPAHGSGVAVLCGLPLGASICAATWSPNGGLATERLRQIGQRLAARAALDLSAVGGRRCSVAQLFGPLSLLQSRSAQQRP